MTSAAEVRAFVASHSRHAARKPWYDWYAIVFVIAMVGLYGAKVLSGLLARLVAPPGHIAGLASAGAGIVVLAAAGLAWAACALGPVTLRPAEVSWLLCSPVERRGVLARAAMAALLAGALCGAALGAVALAVIGLAGGLAVRLTLAIVIGAALGVCAVAAAVLSQPSGRGRRWLLLGVSVVSAAATAAVVAAARWPTPAREALAGALGSGPADLALAVVTAAAAGVLAVRAWRVLAWFPAVAVIDASARAGTIRTAGAFLNVPLVTRAAEDRYWRRRRLVSRPWPRLPGPAAVAWLDWRRLARRPAWVAGLMATAVLPAVIGLATGRQGLVVGVALLPGALAVSAAGATGARQDAEDPALGRLTGAGARATLAARAVLPSLLAASWLAIALGVCVLAGVVGGGLWPLLGAAAAPAFAAGALRLVRSGPIEWNAPVIDTPMGAFPTALQGRAGCLAIAAFGAGGLLGGLLGRRPPGAAAVGGEALLAAATLGAYLAATRLHRR